MIGWVKKNTLYIAWVQSLLSIGASLYFSEILKFPPCVLCWYQRIFMYPLAFIIPIGILRKDKGVHLYVIPLVLAGIVTAIYHNLLYYKIIPESVAPCLKGISCTTKFIEYFGFITIPFLSFMAFATIDISMIMYNYYTKKNAK